MHKRAVLLLLLALLLAGCSGSTTPSEVPAPSTTATEEIPPTGPREPVTWEVIVDDNTFSPSELTIKVGDTVVWRSEGDAPHTVTADNGSFDSHPDCTPPLGPLVNPCMGNGDSFSVTFDAVGEVPYHCKVHGPQTGTIAVVAEYEGTPDA